MFTDNSIQPQVLKMPDLKVRMTVLHSLLSPAENLADLGGVLARTPEPGVQCMPKAVAYHSQTP